MLRNTIAAAVICTGAPAEDMGSKGTLNVIPHQNITKKKCSKLIDCPKKEILKSKYPIKQSNIDISTQSDIDIRSSIITGDVGNNIGN